jgi:hypothetical protein
MTAKTRYFFVGSALVLLLGLGIGTVAYYGGVPGGLFAASPGDDELRYVPEDAAIVAYANVRDVMQSELRQRLVKLDESSEERGRDEFLKETGIDIERDITHVVAFMTAKGGSGHEPNGVILARGRFNPARLEALAVEHGGHVESYKGKKLFTGMGGKSRHGASHESSMALSFVEDGLVVMGHADLVRQAIDRGGSGRSVKDNPDFKSRLGGMAGGSVWAVGRFDSIASRANLPSEVSDRIPPITWFSASGHINGGMQAQLTAEVQTEEAANNLRDIIRGFTALAKMSAGNRPEMQALWPDVELGGTGTSVSVSFSVSSALLDAVTKAGQTHRKVIDKTEAIER